MTAGSANGNPPRRYTATATDGFKECWNEIERDYPRVRNVRLRELLEAQLRLSLFYLFAQHLKPGKMWLLVTNEGVGIPEIHVAFRFGDGHITLEFVGVAEDEDY